MMKVMEKKSLSEHGVKPVETGLITFLFSVGALQAYHVQLNMKLVVLAAPILAYFWVYHPILISYKNRKFTISRGW